MFDYNYIGNNLSMFLVLLGACQAFDRVQYVKLFWLLRKRDLCPHCLLGLFFGKNRQAVAYLAQPLCWNGREIPSPTTHMGVVRKDGAEIAQGWSLPECFRS